MHLLTDLLQNGTKGYLTDIRSVPTPDNTDKKTFTMNSCQYRYVRPQADIRDIRYSHIGYRIFHHVWQSVCEPECGFTTNATCLVCRVVFTDLHRNDV